MDYNLRAMEGGEQRIVNAPCVAGADYLASRSETLRFLPGAAIGAGSSHAAPMNVGAATRISMKPVTLSDRNHFEGMGGPDKVTIELVVHGPALKAFHAASANADITRRFGEFSKAGLAAQACGNSMKTQNVTLKDLLPGFGIADPGGVVRIAELQALGYGYLKP